MRTIYHLAAIALASWAFTFSAGAQQSTPPPAEQTTPPPAAAADLPDSPGSQVKVSPQPTGPTAVMDTTMGRISCRLFDKQAPVAMENFIALAEGTKDW